MSTIVLRSVKGSPLTNTEVDTNFSNLNTDKLEAATSATLTNKTINLTSNTLVATSAQLAAAVTDETGTGALVFANSPTLVTPALGTPASGVVTNLTGTASININGTVGATTANTGAFTTLAASGAVTLSGGTANGVAYLNGSKVLTTGSALTFDGSNLTATTSALYPNITIASSGNNAIFGFKINNTGTGGVDWRVEQGRSSVGDFNISAPGVTGSPLYVINAASTVHYWSTTSGEQMRLTSTGLGIGTTTTTNGRLNVSAGTAATGNSAFLSNPDGTFNPYLQIQHSSAGVKLFNGSSFGAAANNLIFGNSGTAETMRIDGSGNLGLGVTPSAWTAPYRTFQTGTGIGIGGVFGRTDGSNLINFGLNWAYTGGASLTYVASSFATNYAQELGAHKWYTAASGTAGNAISFTQAMSLNSAGTLLIGRTDAVGVSAQIAVASASDAAIQLTKNGVISTRVMAVTTGLAFGVDLADGVTERARITSGGDLLVGRTAPWDLDTSNTSGGGVNPSGYVWASRESGTSGYFKRYTTTGSLVEFLYGTSGVGSISTNGSITLFNTTSDYRLKTVVGAVTGQGARIDALQPVEYTWNADGSRTRGFLAHQFQEVYASSVSGAKDAVDDEGKPVYQSMQASSSEVIADLVAEIQSLRARLAAANL
jgi:hypothetical protein